MAVPATGNVVAQIVIAMTDTGQVTVNTSVQDKVVAYGMLAAAQECIHDIAAQNAQRIVQVPPGSVVKGPFGS